MHGKNATIFTAMFGLSLVLQNAWAEPVKPIDAGPDQTISFPGIAQLVATITDPEPPYMTIGWVKESGPGDVEFSDQRSAVTSAVFTQPGEYTLMLGGFDGSVAYDTVVITVTP